MAILSALSGLSTEFEGLWGKMNPNEEFLNDFEEIFIFNEYR